MAKILTAKKLTKEAFAPYGQVIEKQGAENFKINNGMCVRHHALAVSEVVGDGGAVGLNIFSGQPYALPLSLAMVERHPLGSQAFYPLGSNEWLVIVCQDQQDQPDQQEQQGIPHDPQVFLASADQGINLARGTWHGVLTPLHEASDFLVVDRVGEGQNLEEYYFDSPYTVVLPSSL